MQSGERRMQEEGRNITSARYKAKYTERERRDQCLPTRIHVSHLSFPMCPATYPLTLSLSSLSLPLSPFSHLPCSLPHVPDRLLPCPYAVSPLGVYCLSLCLSSGLSLRTRRLPLPSSRHTSPCASPFSPLLTLFLAQTPPCPSV